MSKRYWLYKVTDVTGTCVGKVEVGGHMVDHCLHHVVGDDVDGWRQWDLMSDGDPHAGAIVAEVVREWLGPWKANGGPDSIGDRSASCRLCGKDATGTAFINDDRFCHGDDDPSPTCYEQAQVVSVAVDSVLIHRREHGAT